MSIQFPNLGLFGELDPCGENIIEKINENFEKIDFSNAFGVERVESRPVTGTTGQQVILDSDNNIYYWTDSWQMIPANTGMLAYDSTNSEPVIYDGTNWVSLITGVVDSTTASNEGTGLGLFIQKTGDNLEFKTLIEGSDITLTDTPDGIIIDSSAAANAGLVSLGSFNEEDYYSSLGADSSRFGMFFGYDNAQNIVGTTYNNTGVTGPYFPATDLFYEELTPGTLTPRFDKFEIKFKAIGNRTGDIDNLFVQEGGLQGFSRSFTPFARGTYIKDKVVKSTVVQGLSTGVNGLVNDIAETFNIYEWTLVLEDLLDIVYVAPAGGSSSPAQFMQGVYFEFPSWDSAGPKDSVAKFESGVLAPGNPDFAFPSTTRSNPKTDILLSSFEIFRVVE